METQPSDPHVVHFGVFELDPRAGELRKSGMRVRLQEQPFQILAMLIKRPGEVVTREELRQKLWADDTFVDFDQGLNRAINKIREALGDSASNPRFVETLPRRGYRFIASVPVVGPTTVPPSDLRAGARHSEPASPDHLLREQAVGKAEPPAWRLQIGLVATLVAAVAVIVALWLHSPEPHQQRDVVRFTLTPGTNVCKPVISPNGRHIAYIACEEQRKLWIWNLNRGEPREIDGTEGAEFPFWSPGGDFIGFAAGGELKKVSVTGGPAVTLCPLARELWGGTWSPDGKTVVFAEMFEGALYEVPSTGGTPKRLIQPEDSLAHL